MYIWGVGNLASYMFPEMFNYIKDVEGFIDKNPKKQGKIYYGYKADEDCVIDYKPLTDGEGYKIYAPSVLKKNDKITFCIDPLVYRAFARGGFSNSKHIYDLLKELMIDKYKDSNNEEIKLTLKYWENNELSMYNQYLKIERYDEVKWDGEDPYIDFETIEGKIKRMYYPQDYKFDEINGVKVVADILMEQRPTSPHLYTKKDHDIDYGDVIIDCGVCEGNFALRYLGVASKIYLFEIDKRWTKCLYKTFGENAVLIEKGVSDESFGNLIKIDDVVQKADFLKMDIEGYEEKALKGAEKLLKNGIKCSICSYHRPTSELDIKNILSRFDYKVSTSKGYMLALFDHEFYKNFDFRRGVVYND